MITVPLLEEVYEPEHVYVFGGNCRITGIHYKVRVPAAALFEYRQGARIQDAMPMVSSEDREFLLSGVSPAGWDKMFGVMR